jgi:hypothetical protein
MKAREGHCISSVILDEPAAAHGGSKGPSCDPSLGEGDESSLGLRQLERLEFGTFGDGCVRRRRAGVALVNIGKRNGIDPGILNLGYQVGGSPSIAICTFDPRCPLAPSYSARGPLSGVKRSGWLSMVAAVGSSLRPAAKRRTARKSYSSVSKTPVASHRRVC